MKVFRYSLKSIVFLFCFLLSSSIFSKTVEDNKGEGVVDKIGQGVSDADSLVRVAQSKIATIDATFNKIKSSDAFKTIVDGYALEFPYGVLPEGGNDEYALAINNIGIDSKVGTFAEVFMKIPKGEGEYLYFIADKVPLSGGTMSGEMRLYLLKSTESAVGKGYSLAFNGLDKPNLCSYVSIDCKGFKEMQINGLLKFDPSTVKQYANKQPVELEFEVKADRLSNIVIDFNNIPTLEFKSLPGFTCNIPSLTLDKSSNRNATGFKLPDWYLGVLQKRDPSLNKEFYGGSLWEGVYAPEITITVPKSLSSGYSGDVVVQSRDFIIDENGLTSLTKVTGSKSDGGYSPVFSGDIGGFKYAVNSLRFDITQSKLSSGGLTGEMSFPICKEESTVGYDITIAKSEDDNEGLDYSGSVSMKSSKKLQAKALGLAQLDITESEFVLEFKNKQLFPKVVLDGRLVIAPSKKGSKGKTVGKLDVDFEGLAIGSKTPYLGWEGTGAGVRFTKGKTSKLAKLPIELTSFELIPGNGGQSMGLKFALAIKLQKSSGGNETSGNGFEGNTEFTIWTKRNPGTKRWKYDDFTLNRIDILVDQGPFSMEGSLSMFNDDPIYGKGYCGHLAIAILKKEGSKQGKINVQAAAIFGKGKDNVDLKLDTDAEELEQAIVSGEEIEEEEENLDEYRYWFFDAQVEFNPGVPLFPGVNLNAFTGGFYYNMVMVKGVSKDLATDEIDESKDTDVTCKTSTGRTFYPRKGIIGLMAGIGIQDPGGGNQFKGDITFGLEFYAKGGLKRIATWGGVAFLSQEKSSSSLADVAKELDVAETENDEVQTTEGKKEQMEAEEPKQAALAANWYVEYDFENKTLVGDFDIYIKMSKIKGTNNSKGHAGRISFYSSPEHWYVYFGRPVEAQKISVNVPVMGNIQSYLCFGSLLPTPPIAPLPEGMKPTMDIDYDLLNIGGGISLGTRIIKDNKISQNLGVCDVEVGFYYTVKAGFDVMLSKTKTPIYCSNNDNKELGINGWYATGQAYFMISGDVRASWDCKLFSGSKRVASAYANIYVFAQFPNPTYLQGEARAGFEVCKKDFDVGFSVRLGKKCGNDSEVSDVVFIEGVNPVDGQEDIKVSSSVTVFFEKAIENFTYSVNGKMFRGYVDETTIKLLDPEGNVLPAKFELSEDKLQAVLTPHNVLPEKTEITVSVSVLTEIKSGESWGITGEGIETKIFTFKTKEENNLIANNDIYYAYPLPGMRNFYKSASTRGFVQFAVLPNKAAKLHPDYEYVVAFYDGNNEFERTNSVVYSDIYGEHNFSYELPAQRLEPSKKYTFKILKSPKRTNTRTTSTVEDNMTIGEVDKGYIDTVVVSYDFSTSAYETFTAKISKYNSSITNSIGGQSIIELDGLKNMDTYEALTQTEVSGYLREGILVTEPMIRFGEIKSGNTKLDAIANSPSSEEAPFSLNNTTENLQVISSLLDGVNEEMEQINMECLLNGTCKKEDVEEIVIKRGKIEIPIGYYLPGETVPVSTYPLFMELDEELKLPF